MEPAALILQITPRGNIANRMIQYMSACWIARRLGARVTNVRLPEWGIVVPPAAEPVPPERTLVVHDMRPEDMEGYRALVRAGRLGKLVLDGFLQRIELFGTVAECRALFVNRERDLPAIGGPDELLVNVRAAEILDGVRHYPLVPVRFYQDLVERTGLRPVFVGQIEPSLYCDALLRAFPDARFLPSQGQMRDFEIVRCARNIAVAVSTFSWLAAWLSDAAAIHLPLCGFLNPAHVTGVDLLPTDDPRYDFHLFPLQFGMPEADSLALHARIAGMWKQIAPRQVDVLRRRAPFVPVRVPRLDLPFDADGYTHAYPDAAMAISEGWFAGPLEHYLELGQRLGYQPCPPPLRPPAPAPTQADPGLRNVALGRPATQSSICRYSRGATRELDAAGAVDGRITGGYGFHTGTEDTPWWQVDLGAPHAIHEIVIHNRLDVPWRAAPLAVQVSLDGASWRTVLRTAARHRFGGADGHPLRCRADPPVRGRLVRLTVPKRVSLHLDEVQIFGTPVPPQA